MVRLAVETPMTGDTDDRVVVCTGALRLEPAITGCLNSSREVVQQRKPEDMCSLASNDLVVAGV
jgi:hypothetical protein